MNIIQRMYKCKRVYHTLIICKNIANFIYRTSNNHPPERRSQQCDKRSNDDDDDEDVPGGERDVSKLDKGETNRSTLRLNISSTLIYYCSTERKTDRVTKTIFTSEQFFTVYVQTRTRTRARPPRRRPPRYTRRVQSKKVNVIVMSTENQVSYDLSQSVVFRRSSIRPQRINLRAPAGEKLTFGYKNTPNILYIFILYQAS